VVCAGEPVKFAFIADSADENERKPREEIFPVKFMCEMLGVTPGDYYARKKRAPSKRSVNDEDLGGLITGIRLANEGRYGIDRILTSALTAQMITLPRTCLAGVPRPSRSSAARWHGTRPQSCAVR
jgi:hypothetical protein